MRLTVYLKDVEREKIEVPSKAGGVVMKEIIRNTLSFDNVQPDDVSRIINDIDSAEKGKVVKHSLSGETILGKIKKRKK